MSENVAAAPSAPSDALNSSVANTADAPKDSAGPIRSSTNQTKSQAQAEPKDGGAIGNAKEAKADPKEAKAPEAAPELFEVKVHGRTRKVTKDELIKMAQLAESANERFESAAAKEREAQSIIENAKRNPIQALMDPKLGLSKDQIREAMESWYSQEFIEPETLTEEQRAAKATEEKLKRYEELEKRYHEKKEREAQEKADAEITQKTQSDIIEALEAHKLPKSKSVVKRIAFYMRQNLANGWEAPMDLIVQQVKNDMRGEDSEISSYTYEQVINRFGEDFVNMVIRENLKKLREKRQSAGAQPFAGIPTDEGTPSTRSEPKERVSMSEVNERLRKMRGGR
jgi:hypothetical protein